MEKQRSVAGKRSFRRFLAVLFALFLYNPLFSQSFYQPVEFTPVREQDFYANKDILFETYIAGILPSDIEITTPESYSDIHFKSMKTYRSANRSDGTKIELVFSFAKKGTYTPSPLEVRIRHQRQYITFSPVNIHINPVEQQPLLTVEFSDGTSISSDGNFSNVSVITAKKGEKINFCVKAQYAKKLLQFNWASPKSGILIQTKEYPFLTDSDSSLQSFEKLVPISDFELTMLQEGTFSFPSFSATALAHNGTKATVDFPEFSIRIKGDSASLKDYVQHKEHYSDQIDFDLALQSEVKNKTEISEEDCYTLAKLRSTERKNPFSKAKKERIELEDSLNIPNTQDEPPSYLLPVFLILTAVCGFILFIFIKKRNVNAIVLCGIIGVCLLGALVYTGTFVKNKFAISKECTLYSIPEESAEAKLYLSAGNRIQILEKTGNWCYVRFGTSSGWCIKDNLIFIN